MYVVTLLKGSINLMNQINAKKILAASKFYAEDLPFFIVTFLCEISTKYNHF